MPNSIAEVASLLSQRLISLYPDRKFVSTVPDTGTEIVLGVQKASGETGEELARIRIGFDAVLERPPALPPTPHKPFCLLSVRNSFELEIHGLLMGADDEADEQQPFIARSAMRLPVGWECIEVFPFFESEYWHPNFTNVWAETDLLGAVVAKQLREKRFESLDPNAAARRAYGALLKQLKDLLDSGPKEESLQVFMRDHPELLSPTHTTVWPKLALGSRQTDFVFREAAGDYLLVELEPSTHRLFRNDGHPTAQLTHAKGQVDDWKRYLEDNLATAQRELRLAGISANPKSLVVMGRSEVLTAANRRMLTTIENGTPKLKIMTYDDVYENAKAVIENFLGPIWEHTGATEIYYLPRRQSLLQRP